MSLHQIKTVEQAWTILAKEDPLWAILSDPGKEGGKWDLQEFLHTGDEDIFRYLAFLQPLGAPKRFDHVLDFGCGVGRLSRAWSYHAERVTGIDIAEPMVKRGGELHSDRPGVKLLHNPHPDLRLVESVSSDLAFSHICLQHMPFSLARQYIEEFARVVKPGGWVVFQLPEPPADSQRIARIRRWLVDHLPFGLGPRYRKWKYGRSVIFNMYFTPAAKVLPLAATLGLEAKRVVPAEQAGELQGTLYFFRKGLPLEAP